MVGWWMALPLAATVLCAGEAGAAEGKASSRPPGEPVVREAGDASYYANEFQGRKTATGERFKQRDKTGASKTLPLGSKAKVTNKANGKSTEVRINDRGPYVEGRVIDLSRRAAKEIGIDKEGVAPVVVEARPSTQPTPKLKDKVTDRAAEQTSGARTQQAFRPEE
jgi:rare lipoprotein A